RALAAILVTAAVPFCASAATAAPLSHSLALGNADIGTTVENVQYRRWYRGGRWIGPAAGVAAGLALGALAARPYSGYYAYGAAPYGGGYYAYGAGPGSIDAPYGLETRERTNLQFGSCTGDRDDDSSFPTWACP